MGISDLFAGLKGKAAGTVPTAAVPTPRAFVEDRAAMFQLAQTSTLSELFAVPRDKRNAGWQGAFFHAVWPASVEVGTPAVFQGPDGFPYLRLQVPQPSTAFESNSLGNLARQAVENAWGAAIFASPTAAEPEYVIAMGVLDSLLTYDSWLGDPVDLHDLETRGTPQEQAGGLQTITMMKSQEILVGTPNATVLPPHTARALYRHLHERWNIAEPRVRLMMNPALAPSRSLVINRKLSEFPSREAASAQARFLLWYLPPRRSILLMPESWTQEEMAPLKDFFPQQTTEAKP